MPIYDIPRISLNNLISIDPHQLRQIRYINVGMPVTADQKELNKSYVLPP